MHGNAFPWTPEIEDEILARIAKGQAVRNILNDDWMPSEATFYRRLDDDSEFCKRYLRARERQADAIFEECLAIADSQEGDVITVDGVDHVNHDCIARAKLRIDTRMRMAGKLKPKVYGDRAIVEGPGPNGEHTVTDVSPTELARRTAFILTQGAKSVENTNG